MVDGEEMTLAILSMYSSPSQELLQASYHTLWSCTYQGDMGLVIVDVKSITAVVAMIPNGPNFPGGMADQFFVVERPGLDVAHMGENNEYITDE